MEISKEKEEKMAMKQSRALNRGEELGPTFYMCGLKGMEKGIDDIMVSLAAKDGMDWLKYKRTLKKSEQWNVEVY